MNDSDVELLMASKSEVVLKVCNRISLATMEMESNLPHAAQAASAGREKDYLSLRGGQVVWIPRDSKSGSLPQVETREVRARTFKDRSRGV
jgi:hypothetical protein